MGLCLLANLLNGALSATHTRSNITSEKSIITQLWFFNGNFNGALSAGHALLFNG